MPTQHEEKGDEPTRFVNGEIVDVVFRPLNIYRDERGWLMELFRHDELDEDHYPRMGYVSETAVGKLRGPHAHREQSDLFAFIGPGEITLYLWDPRSESPTCGNRQTVVVGEANPQLVLIPPGVVHGYKNSGSKPAFVYNFPNRLFAGEGKRHPVDEVRYEDMPDSPYVLD